MVKKMFNISISRISWIPKTWWWNGTPEMQHLSKGTRAGFIITFLVLEEGHALLLLSLALLRRDAFPFRALPVNGSCMKERVLLLPIVR